MRLIYITLGVFAAITGCAPEVTSENTGGSSSSSSVSSSSGMGGFGGSGGMGGTGGFGGMATSPLPECVYDTDCTLVDDCCTCEGIPVNTPFPTCPMMECFAPTCEATGIPMPTAICRASHCVVDADCNQNHALCNSLPPVCQAGKTPIVVNGCWGGCIDVAECKEVGLCSQCANGQACVDSNTMMMPAQHCVDVPDSCNGQISCTCMGESVCGFAQGCIEMSPTELKCVDITTK